MAHLEVVPADDAIRAGLDGIEHVSSLDTSLATPDDARAYEEEVATAKANRIREWYRLWSPMDFARNPRLQPLLYLMLAEQVYFSPTLRPYEIKPGDRNATPERVVGFEKMVEFVGIAHRAGVPITVASHGRPPEAYVREMELLVRAGLSPMDVVVAATRNGTHFFGVQDRLGIIEAGKLADLVLLSGDALASFTVDMLNMPDYLGGPEGPWVTPGGCGRFCTLPYGRASVYANRRPMDTRDSVWAPTLGRICRF